MVCARRAAGYEAWGGAPAPPVTVMVLTRMTVSVREDPPTGHSITKTMTGRIGWIRFPLGSGVLAGPVGTEIVSPWLQPGTVGSSARLGTRRAAPFLRTRQDAPASIMPNPRNVTNPRRMIGWPAKRSMYRYMANPITM